MKSFLSLLILLGPAALFGQLWVDTLYAIQTDTNIIYGTAVDFAGTDRELKMDISYPLDDISAPECGRPLMVIVHGGAWLSGDKAQDAPPKIRREFAKRGYVTASVSYRLGMFHTQQAINCNVPGWNCFNMTDTSEWYRANYRGIQDVNGAIRYLVNHAGDYQIDPTNVFVVGESAGGFVAMGVGFLDDPSEVLENLVGTYPDAPPPNVLYENECIRGLELAADIDSMDLSRPALGSYSGTLNPTSVEYTIQGVGNFYGGAFNNIFSSNSENVPALYLYHQPCDLIVPYNYSRLLAGYVDCLLGFPFGCGYIVNRPLVYGSRGIKTLIDTLQAQSLPAPDYYFDNTTNQFNCIQQAEPTQVCHAIDAYWARTTNMATFFAAQIDICTDIATASLPEERIEVFPNPASHFTTLRLESVVSQADVEILDLYGKRHYAGQFLQTSEMELNLDMLPKGVYVVRVHIGQRYYAQKLIVQ